jgi:hypothetical protein
MFGSKFVYINTGTGTGTGLGTFMFVIVTDSNFAPSPEYFPISKFEV